MPKQVALWERVSGRGHRQRIRQIPNVYAIVDDIDYPKVDQYLWHVLWRTIANGQRVALGVSTTSDGPQCLLHHFILSLQGIPKPRHPLTVDHIDRNPLNNTRENLRIANPLEQLVNRGKLGGTKHGKAPTSSYVGVSRSPSHQKWRAVAHLNGKQYHLGRYPSELEAAHIVNLFYAAHHPTTPLPNPTATTGMSDPTLHCRCRLCRPTRVSV